MDGLDSERDLGIFGLEEIVDPLGGVMDARMIPIKDPTDVLEGQSRLIREEPHRDVTRDDDAPPSTRTCDLLRCRVHHARELDEEPRDPIHVRRYPDIERVFTRIGGDLCGETRRSFALEAIQAEISTVVDTLAAFRTVQHRFVIGVRNVRPTFWDIDIFRLATFAHLPVDTTPEGRDLRSDLHSRDTPDAPDLGGGAPVQ